MTTMKQIRCKSTLKRLQEQLKSGVKTERKTFIGQKKFNKILLTESDKKRIEKEIITLSNKL